MPHKVVNQRGAVGAYGAKVGSPPTLLHQQQCVEDLKPTTQIREQDAVNAVLPQCESEGHAL